MVECHMNVYWWGPHVLASMFKIRVIVMFRAEDGPENCVNSKTSSDEEYVWSVVSFEYKNESHSSDAPHVELIWKTDLDTQVKVEEARVSDIEFKRVPTNEVLYIDKAKGGHFQFLRRVLCTGIERTPSQDTTSTIREIVKHQAVFDSWSSVPVVQGEEATTKLLMDHDSEPGKNRAVLPTGTINDNQVLVVPGNDEGGTTDVTNNSEVPTNNEEEGTMDVPNNNQVPANNEQSQTTTKYPRTMEKKGKEWMSQTTK